MIPKEQAQVIINNLNKVFIPHKSVLEMEALISTCLVNLNYDFIKETSENNPSADVLYDILDLRNEPPFIGIVEKFINITISKLKPVAMYMRKHHDINRMGNVAAYAKTRVPLFLGLYRLKFKFLLIKHFVDRFRENNYQLFDQETGKRLRTALYEDFYIKNKEVLNLMLPEVNIPNRILKNIDTSGKLSREDIFDMINFEQFNIGDIETNFIMRSIKASLFIVKIMFTKIDVLKPFKCQDIQVDVEETIVSNDFIPEMIDGMSNLHKNKNTDLLKDNIQAFTFLMTQVLEGINNGIEIASGGSIILDLDSNLYET